MAGGALEELGAAHFTGLVRYCYNLLWDYHAAEDAQPIEISNIPPMAQWSNVVGELIIADNIRAEVVAVGIFDHVVDIYLTLEDLLAPALWMARWPDGDGNFYQDEENWWMHSYTEVVFDIDAENLRWHRLGAHFPPRPPSQFEFDWSINFAVENVERQLTIEGLGIQAGGSLVTGARINPSSLMLTGTYLVPRAASFFDQFSLHSTSTHGMYDARMRWRTTRTVSQAVAQEYTGDLISVTINTTDGPLETALVMYAKDGDDGFVHIFSIRDIIFDLDSISSKLAAICCICHSGGRALRAPMKGGL